MSRYLDPDNDVIRLYEETKEERFPHLLGVRVKILMDNKPRVKKLDNTIVFGSIKAANEIEKFLTSVDFNDGIDYIMTLDATVFELANDVNRKRIISHELRHIIQTEKGAWKTRDHEINDFFAEIELNMDDKFWARDLAELSLIKIEQDKEDNRGM